MKTLLLNIIKLYWLLIPEHKRRKCIFSKSCSHYVYDEIKYKGVKPGLKALHFRLHNCKPDFDIITDYKTGRKKMRLKTGVVVDEDQIAERLL